MQFDHIVLNVVKMDDMIDFYNNILGFSIERLKEFNNGGAPFPIVRLSDNNIIDLFPKSMWENDNNEQQHTHYNQNHFCLVASYEEWQKQLVNLETNNIVLEEGPVKRGGARGMGMSIYFRDPDHNLIELRYYEGH